ncbi:hypothetical protein AB0I72_23105 [Nocardiopsis sp. NPDC049922]|uniref:hypothetical protein n=1 Tax=Nocardiopsis sp. NPDC049922 TaxID=3155157 RepID=UPI0033D99DC6
MARRTERAPRLARSTTDRRRTRTAPGTRRRLTGDAVCLPQPREDADSTRSHHPITHWVMVTDENGRSRPEARWL